MTGRRRLPDVAARLPKTRAALEYAEKQHAGQRRTTDGAPFIEHLLEVGWLLYRAGDGSLSLFSLVVPPGAETPVHDHLAWGLVGLYRGTQDEEIFASGDGALRLTARRASASVISATASRSTPRVIWRRSRTIRCCGRSLKPCRSTTSSSSAF